MGLSTSAYSVIGWERLWEAQLHGPAEMDIGGRGTFQYNILLQFPVLLPGKSHGWRSLVGCSPWGHTESDTTGRLHFHFSLSCIGEGNGNSVLPLQCSYLENPRDGRAWWAAVHGVAQSRTWLKQLSSSSSYNLLDILSDFPFTFHFHALEKEMATHSSVLAWRIPGTAEPGGLPSLGSHRVRHDWEKKQWEKKASSFTVCGASLVTQVVKNPPAISGDPSLSPGSGRSPGKGIGYPL